MNSSSKSGLRRTLRRLKSSERKARLELRDRSQLTWIWDLHSLPKLLLDTTVYIDQMQGKIAGEVASPLETASLWHSTVTESEMLLLVGALDSRHLDSQRAIDRIMASIGERPEHRIVNPDRDVWHEAGIVTGMLARLQHYGKSEKKRVLNDALILLSAARAGLTVLTRNFGDFDLLQQLVPNSNVIFYDV